MSKLYEYRIAHDEESAPAKLLRRVRRGSRVLEIGCSSGSQTRVLSKELGCQVFAVEIDPAAAELARPYCHHLVIGNIESVTTEELAAGQPYDFVIFADVLEHLYSPGLALEKVRPLIAPDGCLLASIPNVTHAALVFEMMNGRFEYREYGLLDATHIRFFDRYSALHLIEESGYFVEDVDRIVVPPGRTEFRVDPCSDADRFVLRYIRERNSDSDTFQFIIRAVPAITPSESKGALESARRRLERQEFELGKLRAELSRRDSELEWLARRTMESDNWSRSTSAFAKARAKRATIIVITRRCETASVLSASVSSDP